MRNNSCPSMGPLGQRDGTLTSTPPPVQFSASAGILIPAAQRPTAVRR